MSDKSDPGPMIFVGMLMGAAITVALNWDALSGLSEVRLDPDQLALSIVGLGLGAIGSAIWFASRRADPRISVADASVEPASATSHPSWERAVTILSIVVALTSLAATIYQAWMGQSQLQLAQDAFREQRRISAFEILSGTSMPSPAASLAAAQTLIELEKHVGDWEMPCFGRTVWAHFTGDECAVLTNLAWEGSSSTRVTIADSRFLSVTFQDPTFLHVTFDGTRFDGGKILNADWRDVVVSTSTFVGTTIELKAGSEVNFAFSNMTGATIVGDFRNTTFQTSDISGIKLCGPPGACAEFDRARTFTLAYYRVSNPPIFEGELTDLRVKWVCDDKAVVPPIGHGPTPKGCSAP